MKRVGKSGKSALGGAPPRAVTRIGRRLIARRAELTAKEVMSLGRRVVSSGAGGASRAVGRQAWTDAGPPDR